MGRRILNLVLACWALQVSPALCLAGVLAHPCEPDANIPCADLDHDSDHPKSSDHPEPGSCSHEEDCNSDPCQQLLMLKEFRAQDLEMNSTVPAPACFSPIVVGRLFNLAPLAITIVPPNPPMPSHKSDLPLLV